MADSDIVASGTAPSGTVASDTAAREAVAAAQSAAGRRIVLGLTGPPGAGKSTLAEFIVRYAQERMGESWAAYFPMDGYHLSNAQLARLGLENRKGAPATFDVGGYVAMLSRLTSDSGEDVYVPEYDRSLHEPIAARLLVPAKARLIVTEGNYLALDEARWRNPRQFIDQLWYVEAPDPLREERLVARQLAGGREEEAAREWVAASDRPNGELVKLSRARTDRTITPVRA
ncbi:MAG TPA: nucleoside/nucleotide kinase family protein [Trebonia sp.]|nr:nucleoside/nucleotide kinase family protein [Trebonia sp.]